MSISGDFQHGELKTLSEGFLFWNKSQSINELDTVCFEADTELEIKDFGKKKISKIKIGDLTKAWDFENNKWVWAKVLATSKKLATKTLHLTLSDGTIIKATPEHRTWINDQWNELKEAKINDRLMKQDGNYLTVVSIEEDNQEKWVYNLSIEKYHNYFPNGILAHNECYLMDANGNNILDKNGNPVKANRFTTNGHAILGDGKDLRIDLNKCLDTSCYETKKSIMQFKEYDSNGKETGKFLGEYLEQNSDKSFYLKFNDLRIPAQASGEMAYVVGRYTLKLTNAVLMGNADGWTLTGTLKAFDDKFDYNKSNREWKAETFTTILRNLQQAGKGQDYTLQIRGSKNIMIKGGC